MVGGGVYGGCGVYGGYGVWCVCVVLKEMCRHAVRLG